MLIVAHRLSTIIHANQGIVVHRGKVQEFSIHKQLLERNDHYAAI
jgi:ABC-type transport system involved in Fe-S cluster assembly fused permease/ATPase subunit